jgi:hypothetical protein
MNNRNAIENVKITTLCVVGGAYSIDVINYLFCERQKAIVFWKKRVYN